MAVAAWLLYYFYRSTFQCDRYNTIEGLQQVQQKGKQWGLLIVTFLLTVIYLPLSTMAVHVLVWSQDLWVVPNPYTNATELPPVVEPLGPASEYRDPLDFCWTTTMKRNQINFAPVIIIFSVVVFIFVNSYLLLISTPLTFAFSSLSGSPSLFVMLSNNLSQRLTDSRSSDDLVTASTWMANIIAYFLAIQIRLHSSTMVRLPFIML